MIKIYIILALVHSILNETLSNKLSCRLVGLITGFMCPTSL